MLNSPGKHLTLGESGNVCRCPTSPIADRQVMSKCPSFVSPAVGSRPPDVLRSGCVL